MTVHLLSMLLASCQRTTGVIFVALLMTAARSAAAGEWFVVPRLSLSQSWSDNVNLSPVQEQDDYIFRVTPGLSVRGLGRRLKMNLDYNLQSVHYTNEEQFDDTFHQLQSGMNIEVLRDVFFVDASALVYQALVSNTGQITNRNLRTDSNRTDVVSWSIGPTFKHHFGTWADFSASTRISDTVGDGAGGSNSSGSGNGLNLRTQLSSGSRFKRTTWGLSNSRTVFNNDSGGRSSSRSRWRGNGSFDFNRFFRFNGTLGFEDNTSAGGATNRSGVTWSVGATITPNPRTTLTGSYGDRAFGSTKNFSFSWRRRRISISGSYGESLRTTSEELQAQSLVPLTDPFGEDVFEPIVTGNVDLPVETLTLTDSAFVSRNFNATIGYYRRRDTFSASVYRNERTDSSDGSPPEEAIGTTLNWNHTFSRRLSGGVSGSYRSGTADRLQGGAPTVGAGNSDVEVVTISPSLSYSIGPHTQGSLSYTYTDSSSDDFSNNYSENSVSSSLSFAF